MYVTGGEEIDETIRMKLPSAEAAINILKAEFMTCKQSLETSTGSRKRIFLDAFSQNNSTPPKQSKFAFIQRLASSPSTGEDYDEIDNYLKMQCLDGGEEADPLKFWMFYEKTFPTLAKLARQYLGIPASSGSVERLFSVAGAIARSRRANLKIDTVEMALCCRQYLVNRNKIKNNM